MRKNKWQATAQQILELDKTKDELSRNVIMREVTVRMLLAVGDDGWDIGDFLTSVRDGYEQALKQRERRTPA